MFTVREIHLTQGKIALVDDADFERVSQYKWWFHEAGYAQGCGGHSRRELVYMHTFITGFQGVDHKDGNGLNNQRSNLRFATASQNGMNRRKSRGRSAYKGVHFEASKFRNKPWRAQITVDGKIRSLGMFYTEEQAAQAYDEAARLAYGEYARTNF